MPHCSTLSPCRRLTTATLIAALALGWAAAPGLAAEPGNLDRLPEPLEQIAPLIAARRAGAAQAALRQAQQVYRSQGDRHGEALCLLLLGICDVWTADLAAAREDLAASGEVFTQVGDGVGAWMAAWMLGSVEAGAGRFDAALGHQARALALARDAEASPPHLVRRTLARARNAPPLPAESLTPLVGQDLLLLLEAMSRDSVLAILLVADRLAEAEAELGRLAGHSKPGRRPVRQPGGSPPRRAASPTGAPGGVPGEFPEGAGRRLLPAAVTVSR
jgi:hypothetical protein